MLQSELQIIYRFALMNSKTLISILLTGLFMMNIFAANGAILLEAVTGENITIINPFCKKSSDSNTNSESESIEYPTAQAVQISVICTSVYDFENPTFVNQLVEDNFEVYAFTDSFRSDLFSRQFYTPPKL